MNPAESPKAFKPISKAFAADLLGVSTKTIDNYIRDGLLPPPRPFGCRELWHPDDFYRHLDARLKATTATAASDSAPDMPNEPENSDSNRASQPATRPTARDSSAVVRQRQRQARRLNRLNGTDVK